MNRIPDRDERNNDDGRKGGHVTPPERNPAPEREQEPERQSDDD